MKNQVGDIVYYHYTPACIGVVVAVNGPQVTVKWGTTKKKGTTSTSPGFRKFEDLVVEHEKKALRHRTALTNVQQRIAAGTFP